MMTDKKKGKIILPEGGKASGKLVDSMAARKKPHRKSTARSPSSNNSTRCDE